MCDHWYIFDVPFFVHKKIIKKKIANYDGQKMSVLQIDFDSC